MTTASPGNIGRYRLLNVVHTGQASQIWQAFHDEKRRIVGIKTLLESFHKDREQVGYLRWEYSVGQKVVHDRIVQVYEYGNDRGQPYVALEWFSAPNMKQRIQHDSRKMRHLVPKIIEQAAEGLGYFNEQGWVHRDIKPDNFLVGDEGEVKLIDFALAVRAKRGLGKILSPKSKIQGTRSYMSPEQIRGSALDARADVYSLGCTVHELIAGKPPFTGISADDLLRKHLKATPPPLEAYDKNVTPEFADLVRRALAKEPAKRPESALEFLREFMAVKVFKIPPKPPDELPEEPKKGELEA